MTDKTEELKKEIEKRYSILISKLAISNDFLFNIPYLSGKYFEKVKLTPVLLKEIVEYESLKAELKGFQAGQKSQDKKLQEDYHNAIQLIGRQDEEIRKLKKHNPNCEKCGHELTTYFSEDFTGSKEGIGGYQCLYCDGQKSREDEILSKIDNFNITNLMMKFPHSIKEGEIIVVKNKSVDKTLLKQMEDVIKEELKQSIKNNTHLGQDVEETHQFFIQSGNSDEPESYSKDKSGSSKKKSKEAGK